MSGFKNFLLRGNLVDLAVAVIIGTAFGAVVAAFTAWLTASAAPDGSDFFRDAALGDLGFFLNAVISFLILAAVVYFFVVLPYTKAKERYFPSPPAGTPEEVELLRQIRDLLVSSSATSSPSSSDAGGPEGTTNTGGSHAAPREPRGSAGRAVSRRGAAAPAT